MRKRKVTLPVFRVLESDGNILFPPLDGRWYGRGKAVANLFPTQLLSQSQLLLSIVKQTSVVLLFRNRLNWGKGEEVEL